MNNKFRFSVKGKSDTGRIKCHEESDDINAGGAEMFFLFLCERLTMKEVSEVLRLGKTNTYKLFQRKDFPKVTIGKKLLVKESELDGYLDKYGGAIIEI